MTTDNDDSTLLSQQALLIELAQAQMPFGKYRGTLLIDLPEPYVVWLYGKGFPAGKLGMMLQTVYEIKLNGLEYLFDPMRTAQSVQNRKQDNNSKE